MIIELMKEALEAMERRNSVREEYKVYLHRGIQSLKQAIELAERQTPEFNIKNEKIYDLIRQAHDLLDNTSISKKYEWKELSNNEIWNLYSRNYKYYSNNVKANDCEIIARAVEAKLKEKNT